MKSTCDCPQKPDRNAPRPAQPNNWNHGYHPRFTTTTDAYAHELYFDAVGSPELEAFLQKNDQYDAARKKWSLIAMSGTNEQLIGAVCNILRTIVAQFVQSEGCGVEREVVDTLNVPACEGKNEDGVRACPMLLVRASGPSFQIPAALVSKSPAASRFGFSNMATYFSVKLESDVGTEEEILEEMASYARRIFSEQPNRIFVRSPFITEKLARLIHIDRAGSQITPPLDLHQHPATFVRLVAGLSSTRERSIGLDDSIQWTIANGRKTEGTLTTVGPSGERTTYPLIGQVATSRDPIRGRATTCWKVRDVKTSEEYVVKDCWRPDDHKPEHEFLELVKGIPGVVQMVSCEATRGETKDFRCPDTFGQYHNRIFGRAMMRSYGKPLMHFASVLQLLCALRDAIAAHQKLVGKDLRVLHRDISHNNVLLGKEGAPEGERGVIIDFDMAFQATGEVPRITADHNIGTRLFQSIYVVGSCYLTKIPSHDYLDDLESFLYLLTYVFLLCKPDGTRFTNKDLGPSIVRTWGEENPRRAYTNKRKLYGAGGIAHSALQFIDEHWGSACSTLFDAFSWWILARRGDKSDLLMGPDATGAPDAIDPLLAHRGEHYAEVLAIVPPSPAGEDEDEDLTEGRSGPLPPQGELISVPLASSPPPASPSTPAASPPQVDELPRDIEMGPPLVEHAVKTTSPPSVAHAQPRRSARIRNLQLAKGGIRCPSSSEASPPKNNTAPVPVAALLAPQPRRSDRIRKRRLEEDELQEALPAARPVKRRARVTRRR